MPFTVYRQRYCWLLFTGILTVLQVLQSGCAAKTAFFVRSAELTAVFESATFLPEYRYYYTGPEAEPEAILAVHRDFELRPGFWREMEPDAARLARWTERWAIINRSSPRLEYYGSYIVDAAGRKIGAWYSKWSQTTVLPGAGNEFVIYTPGPGGARQRLIWWLF